VLVLSLVYISVLFTWNSFSCETKKVINTNVTQTLPPSRGKCTTRKVERACCLPFLEDWKGD